jgi:formyltetrahydrofolate synthetase
LTFYKEEEFKLGYMVASNPKLELFENKVVNRKSVKLKRSTTKGVANFTQEEFDTLKITLMKTIGYLSNRV